jgi:hypothetical protein
MTRYGYAGSANVPLPADHVQSSLTKRRFPYFSVGLFSLDSCVGRLDAAQPSEQRPRPLSTAGYVTHTTSTIWTCPQTKILILPFPTQPKPTEKKEKEIRSRRTQMHEGANQASVLTAWADPCWTDLLGFSWPSYLACIISCRISNR